MIFKAKSVCQKETSPWFVHDGDASLLKYETMEFFLQSKLLYYFIAVLRPGINLQS